MMGRSVRLPDGTRSVQSPWIWRGFLFMSLIALGLCLAFASGGKTFYAIAWAIVTAGWFTISMWLWRKHVIHEHAEYAKPRSGRASRPATPESALIASVRRGGHVDRSGHVR